MKAKIIRLTYIVLAGLLFGGCQNTFTNLTPGHIPQNPSGIYTISFIAKPASTDVVNGSLRAKITIDESTRHMKRSETNDRVFTYEYVIPRHRNEAKYYFTVEYMVNINGSKRKREMFSEIFSLNLTNRYVVTMQSERGPVGTEIPIIGRGFSKYDRVVVGDFEVKTRFMSPVALSFFIPPLPAFKTYPVTLKTGSGDIEVGTFRIDPSTFTVMPSEINVEAGERTMLLFAIQETAPAGGVFIDVTTDVPDSVIMPEVIIPAEAKTIRIPLEGKSAGSGKLFVNAPGFIEIEIPIRVTGEVKPKEKTAPNKIKSEIDKKAAAKLILEE